MGSPRAIDSAMGCRWKVLLTLWSVLANLVERCDATWVRGEKFIPANGAVFIAKYCFDFDPSANNTGEVEFWLKRAIPSQGNLKVVLLNDQVDSYPDSSERWDYHCDDDRLSTVAKAQLNIDLKALKGSGRLHTFIVERLRPRFWFLAVLDCSGVGRTIEYEAHMLNIEQGWLRELSMDKCGIKTLSFFLVVYLGIAVMQIKALFVQSTANTKHPLRLILTTAVLSGCWSMGFWTFDTIWYATQGDETFLLYLAAKLFKAASKFLLLLILILLSRGRCISHELHLSDLIQGGAIISPFLAICLGLELWGEFDQSRQYTTNFVYQSWVGALLVFADLILLGLYVSNLLRTYREESSPLKKAFYRTWGTVYSFAFSVLPIGLTVALCVAAHVRVAVMFWFSNFVHSVLLTLLVVGLYPDHTMEVFCIDDKVVGASVFGNQAGNLLDDDLKGGKSGGEYQHFDMEDSALN